MSEQHWNEAQRCAIEDEGGALLVSAAAGSGKTAVLVERAVRLITREKDPIPADRLLILTFTNAAAEELRARIAARLEAVMREGAGRSALLRQRMLLRRAFIGTVDAFCIALVREHFTRLGLPPDIAVGEGALLASLADEAMATTMEAMFADEDFSRFAALYGRARTDKPAEEKVRALYEYTLTLPDPNDRLDAFVAMYGQKTPLEKTAWGAGLISYAQDAAVEVARLAAAMAALCAEVDCLAPCAPTAAGYARLAGALKAALDQDDWDGAKALLEGFVPGQLRARGKRDGWEQAQYDLLAGHRDEIKKILAELGGHCFVCTAAEYAEDRRTAAPLVAALAKAARLYGENYHAAKLAERVLDFADFEHLALELLRAPGGGRTPLGERVCLGYDAVMVDEYQDTNGLQSALYDCLGRPDGSNLFFVGDVKQSIYRFRKADPGIFLAKRTAWAPLAEGRHPARLSLGHNYRSGRAVIDGVNYLFGVLMSPALGEMDYGGEERLVPGAAGTLPGGFSLHIVEGREAADEAAFVARRIAEMVAAGTPVAEGGVQRPCGWGDFCILLRSGTHAPRFAAALEARGIPVSAAKGEGLLKTPEVLPLVAALGAIDNPGDDVSLAAAMLGPLFRFTPDELTRLRAAAPAGRLWAALLAARDEKASDFIEQLRWYRALAGQLPVGRLCEELVQRTGYLAAVAAMENGAARRENLRRFIGWAAEVSATGRSGLGGFVRLLQSDKGPNPPSVRILPGRVSILTIHGSKGLEFPFVFLSDAAHAFNLRDLGERVQLHAELGVGLTLRCDATLYRTLPLVAIRRRLLNETLGEELRLLYVALTRAKQCMAVTLRDAQPQKLLEKYAARTAGGCPSPFGLGMERSMAGWLLCALLCHPDGAALLREHGIDAPLRPPGEGRFTLAVERPQAQDAAEPAAYRLTAPPDAALLAALQDAFARTPARRALAAVPAKLSVTDIAKADTVPAARRRPAFMYTGGLTAAERGTAQHGFLQHMDFAAAKADAAAELERLVTRGHLTRQAAAAVDLAGVAAFLTSPLGGRIAAARRVLREYDFITALPAGEVHPGLEDSFAAEPVLVQGIADLVLENEHTVEIVDYKTDRVKRPEELVRRYAKQLALYRLAVERRLQKPVQRLTIWSFALGREVDMPLPLTNAGADAIVIR